MTVPQFTMISRIAWYLVLGGGVAGVAYVGLAAIARWRERRLDPIDTLIVRNAAVPIADMETTDHQKLARAGEIRWQETLRAQRTVRKSPSERRPARASDNLVDFRRASSR